MTISSDQLYQAYKASVGGKGHDGWEMPDHVSGLGDRQQAGWQAAATFCNQHFSAELVKDRAVNAHNRLQQDLVDMAAQLGEKAAEKIVDTSTSTFGTPSQARIRILRSCSLSSKPKKRLSKESEHT